MTLQSRWATKHATAADRAAIRIRELLYGRGNNQADLARAMEKSQVWVSDRLSGRVQLTVNDLAAIADALAVEPADLLRVTRDSALIAASPVGEPPRPAVRRPPARTDASRPGGGPPLTRGRTAPTHKW